VFIENMSGQTNILFRVFQKSKTSTGSDSPKVSRSRSPSKDVVSNVPNATYILAKNSPLDSMSDIKYGIDSIASSYPSKPSALKKSSSASSISTTISITSSSANASGSNKASLTAGNTGKHSRRASEDVSNGYAPSNHLSLSRKSNRSQVKPIAQQIHSSSNPKIGISIDDTEARDHVSDLNIYDSNGSTLLSSSNSLAANGSSTGLSSAPTNVLSISSNDIQKQSQSMKSVTKLSSVFKTALKPTAASANTSSNSLAPPSAATPQQLFTKGPRAVSEQPVPLAQGHTLAASYTGISQTSPSSQALSHLVTTSKTAGGISAYEISPSTRLTSRSVTLDDFHLVKKVGKGGFATVFLVRMKSSNGKYYALKAIKKSDVLKM
jgi:hypothetical protein